MDGDLERLPDEVAQLRGDVAHLRTESGETRALAWAVDLDLSLLMEARAKDRTLLNALRETQVEHGRTLTQLSTTVGGLVVEVAGLVVKVGDLATGQAEHTRTLDQHTRTLDQHTRTLNHHGQMLTEHGQMLTEILRRLPDPDQHA
jgi:hypothetical protein